MADRQEDTREESSSSHDRQEIPVVQGAGESSRPPQFVSPPVVGTSEGPRVNEDDAFKAQLLAAVNMFSQVMQNPRFMAFLQPSLPTPPTGSQGMMQGLSQAQVQSVHAADSVETPRQLAGSIETPRPLPVVQEHVAETSLPQVIPVQPVTFPSPMVDPYGQGSRFLAPQQVFPPPTLHPGYFGGGSVFQSMAGYTPGNPVYTPGTVFGGAQTFMPNPMYGNIGMQPGFQGMQGSFGMPQSTFGTAGFSNQPTPIVHTSSVVSGPGVPLPPVNVPMMQALPMDPWTAFEKPKPYKEGGAAVHFDTFRGFEDRTKALSFIQQFDAAFAGGNFTESSKVRKAATFLKGNASQWWTTLLMQGQAPSTWIGFKQVFATTWLTNEFEVDVMSAWHSLDATKCKDLEDYNRKFWKALLPVTSYRVVPLAEQIEKYCCGLPKELRNYCTKTKVTTLTQLIENANTGNALLLGQSSGFAGSKKEDKSAKFSAKKQSGKDDTQSPQSTGKAGQAKKNAAKPGEQQQQPKNKKKKFVQRSSEEKKVLMAEGKCFICEKTGHIASNCPDKKKRPAPDDEEEKEDKKGKKPSTSAGLVPDMLGDKPSTDASELCRAWGKVRDQHVLIFFDPGAKANFISPELAATLGIRADEMGYTAEAGLACPGHSESVTPILGKLRLHIQSYVDAEEFYIMPLEGCDVLLGMPWLYRLHGVLDSFKKTITLEHRGKTHVLDVKLKGESVPVVSASAITSVIKNHLSAYLIFARDVKELNESNLSVLDKDRS